MASEDAQAQDATFSSIAGSVAPLAIDDTFASSNRPATNLHPASAGNWSSVRLFRASKSFIEMLTTPQSRRRRYLSLPQAYS